MRRTALLVLLAACSGSSKAAHEDLLDGVREFQEGLRWRNYDQAATRVAQEDRASFLDAHEKLDRDLRIDDYEIERLTLEQDRVRAVARVRYTWHLDSVGKVHETMVDETWERQGKIWRILDAVHRSGERLPADALPAVEPTPHGLP